MPHLVSAEEAATASSSGLQAALEAIIYAADEPATIDQLARSLEVQKSELRAALSELMVAYQTDERGIEIREVAGGFKFYTKPHHHDVVKKYIKSLQSPLRLSMPSLETLAVIAYRQPVTLPEINEIRGVNCSGVIGTLLERKLITTAGRKQVMGRPILYKTTKEFLVRFGLGSVDDLPSLKEFEQLAREAIGADDGLMAASPAEGADEAATPADEAALAGTAAETAEDAAATDAAAAGEESLGNREQS